MHELNELAAKLRTTYWESLGVDRRPWAQADPESQMAWRMVALHVIALATRLARDRGEGPQGE